MSKEKETQLKGPWKSVQTAIWLIGLAIIAWRNWWWPGILVLIGISTLTQAVIQILVPSAVEIADLGEEKGGAPEGPLPATTVPETIATVPAPPQLIYPTNRLPSECPLCSAPIRGAEVRWTGPQSADCPYCGANLPLKPA
jgi:hypothetical protein